MRNVLQIVYVFPPLAGSAVQRPLKFAKYLPEFGWMPTVLTIKPYYPWVSIDATLLDEVPSEVEVVRAYSLEYIRLRRALGRRASQTPTLSSEDSLGLSKVGNRAGRSILVKAVNWVQRWLTVPDPQVGWLPFALASARTIMKRKRIEVIYSTSPPQTALLVGYILHKRYKIPWVVDFRDPWTRNTDYLDRNPTWLHRRITGGMERTFVHSSDKVIVVTDAMRDYLLSDYPTLPGHKVCIITHGFDESDFSQVTAEVSENFTLVYVGLLDFDISPLLTALLNLRQEKPAQTQNWRLRLVGAITNGQALERVKDSGVKDMVEVVDYVPHKESLREMLNASALLIHFRNTHASSSKIFEYMRAGRPILALCAEGSVMARLVRDSGAGIVVPPDDAEAISNALWQLYLGSSEGKRIYKAEDQFLARYERRKLTASLARVFDEVTNK